MKLWLLKRKDQTILHDTMDGCVVRAKYDYLARKLAAQLAGDEGAETWLETDKSTCEVLTVSGTAGVILRDFNAG